MQRVSSSPRRSRLNSGDSHHSHRSVSSGGPRRSRSQERSLQEDDADDEDNDSNNYSNSNNNSSSYSQASTEQGSDDHELSDAQEIDQKLLRLEEQFDHTNLISCSSSKDEHVVISATSSNATATTTASNATTTTTATTSNKTHHVQHQHQHHHPSSSQRIYKRAASDRLDSSAVEEETSEEYCIVKDEKVLVVKTHKAHILPTLPRYPVAETRDLNCWSEPPVDIFRVRGYNYLKDHKKVHSEPYLLRARGCDLFLFPKHHNNDKQKSKSNREQQPITMMDR